MREEEREHEGERDPSASPTMLATHACTYMCTSVHTYLTSFTSFLSVSPASVNMVQYPSEDISCTRSKLVQL